MLGKISADDFFFLFSQKISWHFFFFAIVSHSGKNKQNFILLSAEFAKREVRINVIIVYVHIVVFDTLHAG